MGFSRRLRQTASGEVLACVPDGVHISGFRVRLDGRGPWSYNMAGDQQVVSEGEPRPVKTTR